MIMTGFELTPSSDDGRKGLRIHGSPHATDEAGVVAWLTVPELADLRRLLGEQVDAYTGRKVITRAYGSTPGELEANALSEGRLLFGMDAELHADPKWCAERVTLADYRRHPDLDPAARYAADITVRELMGDFLKRRRQELLAQYAPPQPSGQ